MNNEASQKLPSGGAEREARERKEIARKVVAQYNAGFIDQQNNTPRPGLVKLIAAALEICANEARLEALEQAAQVAASHYPTRTLTFVCVERNCSFSGSDQSWANHIAAAIRALKAAQHGEKELRKGE